MIVTMRQRAIFIFGVVVALMGGGTALAESLITQSYAAPSTLAPGSVVAFDKTTGGVVLATAKAVDNLFGVVVQADASLLSFQGTAKNQAQVATSGTVPMIVADINGPVKQGDSITASPIEGVGMRATSNIKVIGTAQQDLATSTGKKTQNLTDTAGVKRDVVIGVITANVAPAYFFKEPDKSVIPAALQNLVNAAVGKQVTPLPIIISFSIFILALVVVASLIFSAIRGSIISVGRNPMAQSAVYRSLLQVTVLILGIVAVAVAAIYLILSRL